MNGTSAEDEREQLLVTASFSLAELVNHAIWALSEKDQAMVAQTVQRGGNIVVMATLVPHPEFRILLATPPNGETVLLCHCAPSSDALRTSQATVSH